MGLGQAGLVLDGVFVVEASRDGEGLHEQIRDGSSADAE
jgi:hypothetical protein